MGTIYISGGQSNKKNGLFKLKLFMFLFLFLVVIGVTLKVTAPVVVERWINQKGAGTNGFAFSIRDVDLSFEKGQMVLKDVKIFNPETSSKLVEAANLTIHLNWPGFFSQEKRISVSADKVDLILSEDFSSEMERIKAAGDKKNINLYLESLEGKIGKLNIIEQKESMSRRVIALNDVNVKVKEVTPLSINKKTEFSISSNIADGGRLKLLGKTNEENGKTPWSIQGSLKDVPSDIFNKIAGGKLPFSFNESNLNAVIIAQSNQGEVSGEIAPDIKRLNLLEERPGIPTQTIARALSDELTFTLPFTLKNELNLEYEDTYKKLKNYRKYPGSNKTSEPAQAEIRYI